MVMLAIVTVIAQKLFQNYEYLLFNFTPTKSRGITTNDSKDRLHVVVRDSSTCHQYEHDENTMANHCFVFCIYTVRVTCLVQDMYTIRVYK